MAQTKAQRSEAEGSRFRMSAPSEGAQLSSGRGVS